MKDLLFKTDQFVFSYRVAGICVHDGKILLQSCDGDPGYAFPGGHVAYGETHAQTLEREFMEETGLEIRVDSLKWIGELFFPWGERPCQQICLYYQVSLKDTENLDSSSGFDGQEEMDHNRFRLHFHWIPIDELHTIPLYPPEGVEYLQHPSDAVRHFIYREQ